MRDVERLCRYFARYHILRDAHDLANDLWGRFQQSNELESSAISPSSDHLVENPDGSKQNV